MNESVAPELAVGDEVTVAMTGVVAAVHSGERSPSAQIELDADQLTVWDDERVTTNELLGRIRRVDLPATLASVDDVRRVCLASGLTDGDLLLWTDETCHVTADVGYEWPGSTEALEAVYVERADDTDVSRVHAGAPAALLWHSIQATRSGS